MAEPNIHAGQSTITWQLPLADLCKELDRICSRTTLRGLIERCIIPETGLGLDQYDRRCSICQESYYREHPAQLPCGHIFGHRCAAKWLKKSKTCPTCRTKLVKPQEKLSYNLSILHPARLDSFRRFLLFIIRSHGVAKGASLDREFQALIRSRPRTPPEIDFSANKVTLWHEICWRRLHNWERKWNEFNASTLPEHHENPYFEKYSLYKTLAVARGDVVPPHEKVSWFSEFGTTADKKAWQILRCRRILEWIRRPWDGYELEFLAMTVSQITDYDIDAFVRNDAAEGLSWNDSPLSPWRLMDSRDYLEYRPSSGSIRSSALTTWLDTLSTG